MRTSTFRKITASFAALAVIVCLGTSPVLARGGGGGGHFGGGGTFIGGGGFHAGGFARGRFSSGRKNVRRRIQSSPLLWRLQRLCGEPVQSVAKSIFVALYVLKRGEASPTATEAVLGQRRADGMAGGGGDADHVLTATFFRYFVAFHSRAIRCASAI